MYHLNLLDKISVILVLIGALNWGFIGLLNFNLVSQLFSLFPENLSMFLTRLVYILIGITAINLIKFVISGIRSEK